MDQYSDEELISLLIGIHRTMAEQAADGVSDYSPDEIRALGQAIERLDPPD